MSLYVGRYVDPGTMAPSGDYAVLEADDLTRHAVCLGMTGSGKTGLCVALLEELAMAGVPVVIIDPKGDMANLALAFRAHRAEDFAPWVDPAAAQRDGLSVEDYAAKVADRWRSGLAEWQITPDRVAAFVDGAEVTVYTPGSTAGVAVDVLGSLGRPPEGIDEEGLLELVVGTVSGLLSLVGVEADPLTDPAHLVLSGILEAAWRVGEAVDLGALITRLVDPPFEKVGVFPLDRFYPRNDRMKLAMQLNGLLASPAFAPWSQGVSLDPERFLARGGAKTPISVFTLAHLDEPRRMFFTSLLLDRIVAWSRRQPGTSSLRALVYFDEVYGYLPPYPRNPPSKRPVLTLMKQARAVGVGTMLVTQNPVDVDYAALSNAGLWLIGRLQTAQDREKVVDGLASAGGEVDRAVLNDWIARLPSRTFVVREAGATEPRLLRSRQVVSYLRGPLTRREIEQLRGPETPVPPPPPRSGAARTTVAAGSAAGGVAAAAGAGGFAAGGAPDARAAPAGWTASPPPAPQGYAYRYLDPQVAHAARLQPLFEAHARPRRDDGRLEWLPAIYARLQLQFDEGRDFVHHRDEHRLFFPIDAAPVEPDFQGADLLGAAPGEGWFAPVPPHVDEARELKALEKRVIDEVLRGETEQMYRHRGVKLESRAGEDLASFRARVERALEDGADAEIAKLKDRVAREVQRLQDRRTRLARDVEKHRSDARSRQVQEVVSAGETLMGLFFGRRRATTAVSRAVSRRGQTTAAQGRAETAEAEVVELERAEYELEVSTQEEIDALRAKWAAQVDAIETVEVRLEPGDLKLTDFGIVWVPVSRAI